MSLRNLMMGGSSSSGNYTNLLTVGEYDISDSVMAYGYATSSVSGYDMGALKPNYIMIHTDATDLHTILAVYCIDATHYAQLQWNIVVKGDVFSRVTLHYGDYSITLTRSDYNIQTDSTTYVLSLAGGDDGYDEANNILSAFVPGKKMPITITASQMR